MSKHTTNYYNTFVTVAEDCPVTEAEIPPTKGDKLTVALRQFQMIAEHPYTYTSDDVLFQVYAERNELAVQEWNSARELFFSKGQPCFRASPLTKRYGWGVHANEEGKLALYGVGTQQYERLAATGGLNIVKAMNSKKK